MKVRGIRRIIRTTKGVTEISVDEAEIEGLDPKDVVKIFKEILK